MSDSHGSRLIAFFERFLSSPVENAADLDHQLRLACAALMFELTRVDDSIDAIELEEVLRLIREKFELDSNETEALLDIARDRMHEATDYYQFTSLLNQHYDQQQKRELIHNLWTIAYADGRIDKYEDHLIRNLAELLHVPHAEFMKAKHQAQDAMS